MGDTWLIKEVTIAVAHDQCEKHLKQELSAGKAVLELKISDFLSKEKVTAARSATIDKEFQRSKALAVNLTNELQV